MPFLSETRERFLRAICATIPAERLIELHFFAPIRQGGIESGVAVVAAEPEPAAAAEDGSAPIGAPAAGVESGAAAAAFGEPSTGTIAPADSATADDTADDALAAARPDDSASDIADESIAGGGSGSGEVVVRQEIFMEPDTGVAGARTASLEVSAPPHRYTVYSATYRLVLKGLDRGKWETSIVAEADAPLLTVETVVRGVQRRSGDTEDPERMTGDEARRAL